jgi:glutathione S-transferase
MILLLKANGDALTFRVTTVNPSKTPPEFKSISNRLPTLVHGTEVIKDNQEIVDYIDEHFPKPSLTYNNQTGEDVTLQVFSKFTFFLKDVAHSPVGLQTELQKINDYLESAGTRYICGDYLTHLDCMLLPKLQHIRVIAKAYKGYEFPHEFKYLWRYLHNAYQSDIFRKTCPSDQEIIYHWIDKADSAKLRKAEQEPKYGQEAQPQYSLEIPAGIL